MIKFEYRTEILDQWGNYQDGWVKDEDGEEYLRYSPLDKLGEQGWQLIGFTPTNQSLLIGFFIRQKPTNE